MKKLLIAMLVLFVGLNIVACGDKKDNSTRLTKGAGRDSGANNSPTNNSGWQYLNYSQAIEDVLVSANPDAAARAFVGVGSDLGSVYYNSIIMKLSFNSNNQINPNATLVGLRFHDSLQPLSYLAGSQNSQISGVRNGNQISVVFEDGGTIRIEGNISGGNFSGNVFFDGQNHLGSFNIPVNGAIFN